MNEHTQRISHIRLSLKIGRFQAKPNTQDCVRCRGMVSLTAPFVPSPLERLGVPPSRLAATTEGKKGFGWGFGCPAPRPRRAAVRACEAFRLGADVLCSSADIKEQCRVGAAYRAGHKPTLEIICANYTKNSAGSGRSFLSLRLSQRLDYGILARMSGIISASIVEKPKHFLPR